MLLGSCGGLREGKKKGGGFLDWGRGEGRPWVVPGATPCRSTAFNLRVRKVFLRPNGRHHHILRGAGIRWWAESLPVPRSVPDAHTRVLAAASTPATHGRLMYVNDVRFRDERGAGASPTR